LYISLFEIQEANASSQDTQKLHPTISTMKDRSAAHNWDIRKEFGSHPLRDPVLGRKICVQQWTDIVPPRAPGMTFSGVPLQAKSWHVQVNGLRLLACATASTSTRHAVSLLLQNYTAEAVLVVWVASFQQCHAVQSDVHQHGRCLHSLHA